MNNRIKSEFAKLSASESVQEFHSVKYRDNGYVEIRGKKVLNLTSWDFFDLNSNRAVRHALQGEVEESGINSRSSRMSSGTSPAHLLCESRIAKFLSCEKSLLFSSKNQAILSLFSYLLSENDQVLIDEHIQSPVFDACRLSGARPIFFNSANLSTLEKEFSNFKGLGDKYVFVESISPLTGRKIDLATISEIIGRHGGELIVDESYSIGIQGLRGAGGCEESSLVGKVLCLVGALTYGIPGFGGVIAGGRELIDLLANRSRTFSNEVPLPFGVASCIEKAIDFIEFFQTKRDKLANSTILLRQQLSEVGFLDATQSDSPIVSVMVGKSNEAKEMARALFERGFLVDPVITKTSLSQVGFIRAIVNTLHTDEQLKLYSQAVSDIFQRLPQEV